MISLRKIFQSAPAKLRGLILFPLLLILASCSGGFSSIYNFDYPLTEKTAKSNSTLLEIKIPKGWFVAEDNEHNSTDLWLVRDDYSATIKFVMISVNDDDSRNVLATQLERIADLNKLLIKTKLGKEFKGFSEEDVMENGTQRFLAYQYSDQKNQLVRTVIFKRGIKYFEATAYVLNSANYMEVFKAQNSVLASLK